MQNLNMRRLEMQQAAQIYTQYMQQDFPPDELKPFAMIEAASARGEYECLGFYAAESFCGYAYLLRHGQDYLLDYFAVRADLRGRGYGSAILQMLHDACTDAAAFLIESENPDYAADAAELAVQQRRLRFYLHAGCADTGVTARVFGVEYRILELPLGRTHTPDEIRAVYMQLYQSFLSAPRYQKKILVR
ncbi:MAG: GNAT family N-acetyltransferase [Oscillospiraceae bacterium]|nr:GNAT family N-acetyltransferase [Oscillospiraceae bacterium]